MAYKCGPSHGNYQHGGYSKAPAQETHIQEALAKDLLRRILTTPVDGAGNLPFTREEQAWAIKVCRERPRWSRDVLKGLGFPDDERED